MEEQENFRTIQQVSDGQTSNNNHSTNYSYSSVPTDDIQQPSLYPNIQDEICDTSPNNVSNLPISSINNNDNIPITTDFPSTTEDRSSISPKKKPLPPTTTARKNSKPLPPRPSQTSSEVNHMMFTHPSMASSFNEIDNLPSDVTQTSPFSPPKVYYQDYTDTNMVYSSSPTNFNYEYANINPEPISHIFTSIDGKIKQTSSIGGSLINRRPVKPLPTTPSLIPYPIDDSKQPTNSEKLKTDDPKKQQETKNNVNKKTKKIFYNTEFLERCGFSNNSIEQQQLKQLKQDEIQEEKIRRMHLEQEKKMKQTELEELALVNRTIQQEFSFSEYLTSQPKYSWSDFFAHNKNAFSLIRAMASQWSWGEMTLGLEYFARSKGRMKRDFSEFILESQMEKIPSSDVEVWRHYARLTYQVFRDTLEDIPRNTKLELHNIIAYDRTQQAMRPGYFLCVDEFTKSILVIFRGTKSFSDILTDLHCSSIRYRHGYCHKGILTAAQYFDSNKFIKEVVKRTLDHHPGYKLRLLGHSLGGGTAAILSTMWKKDFPDIHCYAFACPPVLSQMLSDECADYVTTFVNGDDFVTRLSMTAVHVLRKEVQDYPWKEEMMKDIQNSMIGKFATGVKNYASGLFSGFGLFGGKKQEQEQIEQAIVESKKEEQEIKEEREKEEMEISQAIEESKRLTSFGDDTSNNSLDVETTTSLNYSSAEDSQGTIEENTSASSSGTANGEEGISSPSKKKTKKPKPPQESPLIINDFENLVVTLVPPGCVYQIRNINGKVYIKKAKQEEISSIILSDSYKEDHRMINYLCNLDAFETGNTESIVI